MRSLREIQTGLQAYILDPESVKNPAWVSGGGRATPAFQLSAYANAYLLRLKEVLSSDYPAVKLAISNDRFDSLVEGYIQAYPSQYFSLREYGCHFPAYIGEKVETDRAYRGMAWLAELALFEWKLGEAFDAADSQQVGEQDLAAIPADEWPTLKFGFSPSVNCIDLAWNVPVMWKALTADPPQRVDAVQTSEQTTWLIWRQDLVTRFRSLELDEQRVFDVLRKGATFSDACALLAAWMDVDEVSLRAATLLKTWINQGLIATTESR
jgi:hypothetical protein